MLCNICCNSLQGILNPLSFTSRKQVCTIEQFKQDSGFEKVYVPSQDQTLPVPVDRPPYMFGHHLTLESFERSVRGGCPVCVGMKSSEDARDYNQMVAKLGYYSLFKHQTIRVSPYTMSSSISIYSCDHSTSYDTMLKGWIGPVDNFNVNISSSTGDETTFRLIEGWLDTCLGNHKKCTRAGSFVPSRLLQFDAAGNFWLIQSHDITLGARYATFTHCYTAGDSSPRLTQSTIRLNLKYLWVDRLCVIQDSQSDLAAYKDDKSKIFANSFLGIGAASSSSPASGLFVERDPEYVTANNNQFYTSDEGTIIPLSMTSEVKRIDFLNEPLSRSAKALEERLLTPRMIHFGREMIFWECYGAIADEVHHRARYIGTIAEREGEIALFGSEIKPLHGTQYTPSSDPTIQIYSQWWTIIEWYTQCEMQSQDGGLLLEYLASKIKRLLEQQGVQDAKCLAGMWENFFPAELLWNSTSDGSRCRGDSAPSWSWLALNAPINFSTLNLEKANACLLCEMISASCTPDGTTGSVVLRGRLVIANVSPKTVLPLVPQTKTTLEIKSLKNPDNGSSIANVKGLELKHQVHWYIIFDTKDDVKVGETFVIPIGAQPERREQWWYVRGMALRQLDAHTFIRCGYCSLSVDSEEEARALFKEVTEREITII